MKNLYRGLLMAVGVVGLSSLSWGQCFQNTLNVATYSTQSVGKSPESVVVGDFNGDGKPDLATANFGNSSTVSVLLNNGTGGFGTATDFSVGGYPLAITTGDFNSDNKADLVTVNLNTNSLSILLNTGNGRFGTPTNISTGNAPQSVAVGDFNADGNVDLVVTNAGDRTVSVFLNRGNGSFGPLTNFGVGSNPRSVAVVDFNGDNRVDLAVANYGSNSVSLLLNTGDGNFGPATDFVLNLIPNLNYSPQSIATGDFNSDGKPDLTTANNGGGGVSVLFGNGNGGLLGISTFSVGDYPQSVVVSDFNSDGKTDIATANTGTGTISILIGNGTGSFTTPTPFNVGPSPYWIVSSDFNSDGRIDLATANQGDNTVSILFGNGVGSFGAAAGFNLNVGSTPYAVAVGDFNSDGKPDLVTANYFRNTVTVVIGKGGGIFNIATSYISYIVGAGPISVVVGDFNGDGKPDLATANVTANTITVLLGNGNGGFSYGPVNTFNVNGGPRSLVTGDFNSDGKPDLATANPDASTIAILLGNGIGGFNNATYFNVGNQGVSLAVGDVNIDGKPDLVTANQFANNVSVLLNNGIGGFGTAVNLIAGSSPQSVAVSDINADGKPDLAVANAGNNTVSVLLNTGNGSFATATTYSVDSGPRVIIINDVNADGKPDLATANQAANSVSALLGNGNGGFSTAVNFKLNSSPLAMAVGDFNGDGQPDLVTANNNNGTGSLLLNCAIPINLVLTTPTYDCTTGQLTLATIGGNGVPIEYRIAGLHDFSASPAFTVPAYQRSGTTFTLEARQNGQVISAPFLTACQSTTTTPPTSPTQPTGIGLTLITPAYDCNAGQLTLATTGGNGAPIDFRIAGLRDYGPSPTFTVPAYQRTGTSFTLEARQSGVVATLPFTSACQSATTTPPTSPTQPTGGTLIVSAQPLNCQTGALQLTTTGGNGTPIDFKVPGLRDYSAAATFTVPTYQRSNTTFTLYARQGGQEVTATYAATCPVSARLASAETGSQFEVVVYPNPVGEQFTVGVTGAAGQAVRFHLTNINGQTVVEQRAQVVSDAHTETLRLPASGAGLYLLQVSTESQSKTLKVLKP